MAKSLSAATKLKIARSLKGNKNAFRGGPKKSGLSTRQKIANINAATKAKKANLSSDQIARRQAVAKRLRAQARREEALGGGNPGELKTNAETVSAALAQSDRLKAGALQQATQAKSADDIRAATAKLKEARAALKDGMPRAARKESPAKVQPKAKQKLNAPQVPTEQRSANLPSDRALEGLQRQAKKARELLEFTDRNKAVIQPHKFDEIRAQRAETLRVLDQAVDTHQRGLIARGGPTDFARQQGAQVVDVPISGRGSRGGGLKAPSVSNTSGPRRVALKPTGRDKPQPPQSDTGTDRSGTFTKKVPVKGEKSTRSNGRKAIETEEDLQDFIVEKTPDIIRKLAKGIPQSDLRDLKAMIGKEMGAEGLDALNDILKG